MGVLSFLTGYEDYRMKTEADRLRRICYLHTQSLRLEEEANALLVGQKVRVLTDYNGQPYGSSKPSLKGHIFTVTSVLFGYNVQISLEGQRLFLNLDEVEEI